MAAEQVSRVLVSDGQWRKALAVVRSLGRAGHTVAVAGDRRLTTSFFSRHCAEREIFPTASDDPQSFLAHLQTLVSKSHYDLLVPLEDETVMVCARHREALESHVAVPLPELDSVMLASDKALTREAAERCGYSSRDIVSGGGHDACNIARIASAAMVFCPCIDGISHNEAENIRPEWATAGANVLLHALLARAG